MRPIPPQVGSAQGFALLSQTDASAHSNHFFLLFPGHARESLPYVDVYLRADPEFRKVDPRLHRKTRSRNHASFIMRLQIVHIRSASVYLRPDAVPSAMKKVFPVPSLRDVVARRIVHFVSRQRLSRRCFSGHIIASAFAGVSDDLENTLDSVGNRVPTEPDPRNVVVHSVRMRQLGP